MFLHYFFYKWSVECENLSMNTDHRLIITIFQYMDIMLIQTMLLALLQLGLENNVILSLIFYKIVWIWRAIAKARIFSIEMLEFDFDYKYSFLMERNPFYLSWESQWAHFPRGLFALCSQPEAVALGASWGSWQEKMSTAAKPKKLTRAAKKSPLLASPSTASARNWFRKIDSIAVSPFVDYLVELEKYQTLGSNSSYWGKVLHAIDRKNELFQMPWSQAQEFAGRICREWWRVE